MPEYTVVLKSSAGVWFEPDQALSVRFRTPAGEYLVTCRTRYVDEGVGHPVARELWVEVIGSGESLESAIEVMASPALSLSSVLAFVANAHSGELEVHVAFDSSAGVADREFLQVFVRDEKGTPWMKRRVDPSIVVGVLAALEEHPRRERLQRAVGYYRQALLNWQLGAESSAVSALFMGFETLKDVALDAELARLDATEIQLAQRWDIPADPANALRKRLLDETRRRLLFHGDAECHKLAKRASDGLEHGFMDFHEIRMISLQAREATARHFRQSVIELLDPPTEIRDWMLAEPRLKPIGYGPLVKYLKGRLLGEGTRLAAAGEEYPMMTWEAGIKKCERKASGEFDIELTETMTVRTADDISFKQEAFEIWHQ